MEDSVTSRMKKSLVNWLMEFASENKKMYLTSVLLAFIGVICSMFPYYYVGSIISKLLQGYKDWNIYQRDILLIILFWTLRVLFHSLSTSRSHKATFAVLSNIRKAICHKLTRVPLGDVTSIPSGSLKNIIVERVDSMETSLAHILPEFTANISAPILLFIFLLTINWKMALASLLTVPVGMVCMMGMYKDTATRWATCIEKTKILNDTAVEYINGIEVIKAFGKADSSYEKFQIAAKEGAYCFIDWMRASIIYFTSGMALMPSTMLGVLPIGGFMYLRGTLSIYDFIMVIVLALGLITPFITMMSYSDDIAKVTQIFEEVDKLLSMKEMIRPDNTIKYPNNYDISLSDVSFSYDDKKEVLHNINLKIKQGSINALVGPSGSGKSTIARLIAGLWDVDKGEIKIDDINVKNISFEDYNKMFAYVSQDNYLFNVSVYDNIAMGKKGTSKKEVEEVAKKCGCHDFIMSLENGYETIVGDAGGHLSGGERQRISIARAMLKDAPIIILDEATAYTDPENEALIQKSLAQIIKDKTLIIIAHRLSTIIDADQIIVVDNGEIVSTGTHKELLDTCKLYKNMWDAHISVKDNDESRGSINA